MAFHNFTFYVLALFTCQVFLSVEGDTEETKRILASDPDYVHSLEIGLQGLKQQVETMSSELHSQKTLTSLLKAELENVKQHGHGDTYVRWGRNTCPGNSTELVYSGYAGGSWYYNYGSAANYICLPSDPQWYSNANATGAGQVYGAEYQQTFAGSATLNDNVPCCVCRPATRSSIVMIPGRTSCYPGWQTEYQGYLSSGHHNSRAASEFVCLDKHPEAIIGGHEDENGVLFEDVAAECGSLPCPPYFQGRRMTCVVCSR